MMPQKEDITRQIKNKTLPSKEVTYPERFNPIEEFYSWWKTKTDRFLIIFCSSLFTASFLLGHHYLNPMLQANPDRFGIAIISLFSLDFFFFIFFLIFIFITSLLGAIPLIPFSLALGVLHKEEQTLKSFALIAYTVGFLFFPVIIFYKWILMLISSGYIVSTIILISLSILSATLIFSVTLVYVMSKYNKFFYELGMKIQSGE